MKKIIIFLSLLPFVCFGQGPQFSPPAGVGSYNEMNIRLGGFRANRALYLPLGFQKWTTYDSTGMVWFDTTLDVPYYHNGTSRVAFGSGGGGSGTVTQINTTYPVLGGPITTTGAISIGTASGSVTGALDSNDFEMFAGKQDAINLTTIGTGGASSLSLGELNIPVYQAQLGFTPENVANKATDFTTINNTLYPSVAAVNTQINSAVSIYAPLDTLPYYLRVEDSVYGNDPAYVTYTEGYGRFTPYVNPVNDVNWGNNQLTVRQVTLDSILAKDFETGVHIHGGFNGQSIATFGRGGTKDVEIEGVPITVPGDSVLTTTSTGKIIPYDLKGKLLNYLLTGDTAGLSARIDQKQNFTDTSTWDATRSWVQGLGYGNGTVTSAGLTGYGLVITNSPITTSGNINANVDSSIYATRLRVQKGLDSVAALAGGSGVQSITSTDGSLTITGTTTVNASINVAHTNTWTATQIFNTDITVNGVNIGRGGANVTSNTRVGEGALANNSVSGGGVNGTRNTALGDGALAANTTGSTNTGVGSAALEDVTTGTGNTAVGDRALGVSTGVAITGNTAVGLLSQGSATGSSNTTMGWQSATAGTFSASFVTAIGALSGQALTSGAANTFVGYNSGNAVTTGTSNILYGPNAGSLITTGSFNVLVGSYTGNSGGLDSRTTSNRIVWSDGQTNIRGVCFSTGNWVLGGVTDNATDKLQVVGSLSFTSAPTGTASQADISWNGSTGQATSWQPLNTITASGNQTFSVPALFVLDVISFSPAGNETIRVGTTNGGQELMADQAFTGGTITTVSINQRLSRSGATTIYINGSSGSTTYDISIKK